MTSENYDDGVRRSWARKSRELKRVTEYGFHWGMLVEGDQLIQRQVYMMREGRHSLHNMIRGDHGLPNRY